MQIITLTTDLGLKDYYVGSIKGALLSELNDVCIVDITHNIDKFDIIGAAFVLKNSYNKFPKGTIHILGVGDEEKVGKYGDEGVIPVVMCHEGYYFIGGDNGAFSLMLGEGVKPDVLVDIDCSYIHRSSGLLTFTTLDLFVPVACMIVKGTNIEEIGTRKETFSVEKMFAKSYIDNDCIVGNVIYIDWYGNVITNITKDFFTKVVGNKRFALLLGKDRYCFDSVLDTYSDAEEGDIVVLFSISGFLEISMNKSNLAEIMQLKYNDVIRIEIQI